MHKMKHWYKLISIMLVVVMLIPAIPVYAAESYTVTFLVPNADGTVEQYPVEVTAGEAIGVENMPDDPELPGRVFVGWYYKGEEVTAETKPTEDMYVVAARTTAEVTYTVTFYVPDPVTGNAEAVKVIVKEGNKIGAENIPEIPEVDGKYIIGWISSGEEITDDYIPVSDMDVFAKYGTYSQISAEIEPISGIRNGTSLSDIELPATVTIYASETAYEVTVEWDLDNVNYDENSEQEQTFVINGMINNLPKDIHIENQADLIISVWVTVAAAEKKQESTFDYDAWYWAIMQLYNQKYPITAEAGIGGSISNEGKTSVKYNQNITYTITPDEGYEIETVYVDGKDIGIVSEYTFKKVNKKHTISVSFSEIVEEISVNDSPEFNEAINSEWLNPFNDIFETDSYYDAVKFVNENDLFKGVSDFEFAPYTAMTRAMYVTVLGRLAGVDTANYTDTSFEDAVPGTWYGPYVEWAANEGIVLGYGNGKFGVDDKITIEQAVVILARYAEANGIIVNDSDIDFSLYTDINNVSDWALIEMMWALESGVYQIDNAELNPQEDAVRILVAEMLYNFCNIYLAD